MGEDPLTKILGVLLPVLDRTVPGLAGQVVADALVGAFAHHYRCELPGDAELLQRIGHPAATPWKSSSPPAPCRSATPFRSA